MNEGKTVFAQIMEFLPLKEFRRCVRKYNGEYKVKSFSCLDQFYSMAFAQLMYRDSLRDIEACLRSQKRFVELGEPSLFQSTGTIKSRPGEFCLLISWTALREPQIKNAKLNL